jgi:uncharacterized protein (DUF697 family)
MTLCKDEARKMVNHTALAGGMFAVVPIHGHSAMLAAFEAGLGVKIAMIYGIEIKVWKIVAKFILKKVIILAGVGVAAKALATAAVEALNYLPVAGWLAKGTIAATVIKGLGESAILVFEEIFPEKEMSGDKPSIQDVVEDIFIACVSNYAEMKTILTEGNMVRDLSEIGLNSANILKNVESRLSQNKRKF